MIRDLDPLPDPADDEWPVPPELLELTEGLWSASLLAVQAETREGRQDAARLRREVVRHIGLMAQRLARRHATPL